MDAGTSSVTSTRTAGNAGGRWYRGTASRDDALPPATAAPAACSPGGATSATSVASIRISTPYARLAHGGASSATTSTRPTSTPPARTCHNVPGSAPGSSATAAPGYVAPATVSASAFASHSSQAGGDGSVKCG